MPGAWSTFVEDGGGETLTLTLNRVVAGNWPNFDMMTFHGVVRILPGMAFLTQD